MASGAANRLVLHSHSTPWSVGFSKILHRRSVRYLAATLLLAIAQIEVHRRSEPSVTGLRFRLLVLTQDFESPGGSQT